MLHLQTDVREPQHFGATLRQSTDNRRTLALPLPQRQNDAVPSIQIKDAPAETHAILRKRAAHAHQSLQEYLLAHLIEEAARPTLDEVLDRAEDRAGGSVTLAQAARTLRADRARR